MPIAIADSVLALLDRLEVVLLAELPGVLAARGSSDYPLPSPEAWLSADEDMDDISRHLGRPPVYGSIVDVSSELNDRATGDGTEESYNQVTEVVVSVVMKRPAGAKMPVRNGRRLLVSQWMKARGHMYKGALQDVLTEHVADGVNVHQVELETSGVSPGMEQNGAVYREAAVVITVTQHVSVKVRS